MKYLNIAILSLTFVGFTLVSCESTTEINVEDLETACDHVNALDEILTEMLDLTEMDAPEDLEGDDKKRYNDLKAKLDEVGKAMEEKFDKSEYKKCPDYALTKRKKGDIKK